MSIHHSENRPDTSSRILQATLDLLLSDDGASARMSDIAKKAGVSRQAVYLHFDNRAELLIAATIHLDEILKSSARLAPSRAAETGIERLDAFVLAWGNYIPEIYGVSKALIELSATDAAAKAAWNKRMRDVREGCEAAISALARDKMLAPGLSETDATDILWTMLSVRNWEHSRFTCEWSQEKYVDMTTIIARRAVCAQPADSQRN